MGLGFSLILTLHSTQKVHKAHECKINEHGLHHSKGIILLARNFMSLTK